MYDYIGRYMENETKGQREREGHKQMYTAFHMPIYIYTDITHTRTSYCYCTEYIQIKLVDIGKHQEASFVEVDCK